MIEWGETKLVQVLICEALQFAVDREALKKKGKDGTIRRRIQAHNSSIRKLSVLKRNSSKKLENFE